MRALHLICNVTGFLDDLDSPSYVNSGLSLVEEVDRYWFL